MSNRHKGELQMGFKRFLSVVLGFTFFISSNSSGAEKPLRVNGSTTVNLVVSEAAEILSKRWNIPIYVDTQGGSSGGISSLADKLADIGMISKPLDEKERQKYRAVDFVVTQIGVDAVALVVNKEVFDGGVQALTQEQVQAIYEKKITNWKEVGGKDEAIFFYNKEPGRGTWEVFAKWVYGDVKNVPPVSHAEVGGNEEGRTKVATTAGAITQLSASWAEGSDTVTALGIKLADGAVVFPTKENIQNGTYPLVRPLNLITDKAPTGKTKEFIDFLLSTEGQELVKKHGYLALNEL